MIQPGEQRNVLQSALRRAARFTSLWSLLFVLLLLAAAAEGFLLWHSGVRYQSQTSLRHISVADFSVSTDGAMAVSRIRYRRNSSKDDNQFDVVLHDVPGQGAVRLHLESWRPCRVALSPTTSTLAIACSDGSIYAWCGPLDRSDASSTNGERLRPFNRMSGEAVDWIAFSPDGCCLAAVEDQAGCLWKWPSGELVLQFAAGNACSTISFSADSQKILSVVDSAELQLWDISAGKAIASISTGESRVIDAALSPDARLCAFSAFDTVCVFDFVTGVELWRRPGSWKSVDFSRDGRFLATVYSEEGSHYRINLYDAQSGDLFRQLAGHEDPIVRFLFGSNGELYSWDIRGLIRCWNVNEKREQWRFSAHQWATTHDFFNVVDSRDGR